MLDDRRTALASGTFIEEVELTDCFARGGLSLVYHGKHPRNGDVIVKEFCPLGSVRAPDGKTLVLPPRTTENRKDFSREAHNLEAIRRRSLGGERWRAPVLLSRCEANGTLYLMLENISGAGVGQHALKLRRGDAEAFARWMKATFEILLVGLEAFEAAGIVHGDVTPDNIIIAADDGRPTFIDFGSAHHHKDYRASLGPAHASFRPPRAVLDAIIGGAWIDVHGLCSTFHYLVTHRPPFENGVAPPKLFIPEEADRSDYHRILAPVLHAIDCGMVVDLSQEIFGPYAIRQLLGIEPGTSFGPNIPSNDKSPATAAVMRRSGEMANLSTARHQACILQSFDTPRFRTDDSEWLKRTDGEPLITSLDQKVALARAEALLAICFGREIVVPAGQVADSQGFEEVFNEIYAAYKPRQQAIKAACERVKLPEWRPFRLGLERPELRDYVGFTQSYRYTGADMVLLTINDENVDKEKATAAFFQEAVKLFGQQEFSALGDLMRTKAKRDNFEPFARNIHAYFDPSASVFADPHVPEVSTGEYASLFRSRLEDARLAGRGLDLARDALDIVTQIESDLKQHGLEGFRGNWYIYRKKFKDTWPLARAYLDFRLFMNLARIYDIDHPILVSQAFEYGVFDHSLFLGPKFGASEQDSPDREVDLLKLAACTSQGVNWDEVLEMFLDDDFLRSIRIMNRSFFSKDPDDSSEYTHHLHGHAGLLARKAQTFLKVDAPQGRVGSKSDASATQVMIDAVDAVSQPDAFSTAAQSALDSVSFGTKTSPRGGALIAIAPVDASGNFNLGDRMADQMLNYYIKPYRLLMNRNA
ncbi:hypothetical protein BH10PSE12_BH10PSE12_08480 [soil metagenome]